MLNQLPVDSLINYALALLQTGFAIALVGWSFGQLQQQAVLAPCRVKSQSQPPSQGK